jgi:ubiquinone/menaquinone biosynthesis C-methylase UbiE
VSRIVAGAVPSPNIWRSPDVYEIENRAVDPDRVIETVMGQAHALTGASLLDIGCGTGFHLPRFAAQAARVWGLEPHRDLAAVARRRCRDLENVRVLAGSAHRMALPDASIDVAHARWAYFFGPGCEPGLAELARVMRRGGTAFVVDNDPTRSTFGRWFSRALPAYNARRVDEFFSRHGWSAVRREIRWQFESRQDFEAVVRIEFAPDQAERILAEHSGCQVDYAITIRVRHF